MSEDLKGPDSRIAANIAALKIKLQAAHPSLRFSPADVIALLEATESLKTLDAFEIPETNGVTLRSDYIFPVPNKISVPDSMPVSNSSAPCSFEE